MMKLYAISDLHLGHRINRQALEAMPFYPDDWLILAGDVGETEAHLHFALAHLTLRFARVIWVPGNHDLWTLPTDQNGLRGEAKYQQLVSICRDYGVLTPEDPYVQWTGAGPACLLVPLFLLYDYSFRPDNVAADQALDWAAAAGLICVDEELLHFDPHPSRSSWCAARCQYTESRLRAIPPDMPLVLINHFPLRQDLLQLIRIPRFSLWCGTNQTEEWHVRFPVTAVVYGHLHMRGSHVRNGVRFEEVSLGYPRDWNQQHGLHRYLREILPGQHAYAW
jgi:hypothetical protein